MHRPPVMSASRWRQFSKIAFGHSAIGALLVVCLSVMGGCSKDEMKKMATSVQQQGSDLAASAREYTQAAVEVVEEQLPTNGSVSLRLMPPVEISSASVEVIVVGGDRPNVVQIATYDTSAGPAKFPCMLVHGPTSADTAAALAGQTIPCDLYIQEKSDGPITMTPPGTSVQVTFNSLDTKSNTLKVSIGSTPLIATDSKSITLNGGNAIAKISGGN